MWFNQILNTEKGKTYNKYMRPREYTQLANSEDAEEQRDETSEYFQHSENEDDRCYRHLASISSSVRPLVSGITKYINTRDATPIRQNM